VNGAGGSRLLLAAIALLGLSLRSYHLDFPPIGYHAMKEAEYLSIAHHYFAGPDDPVDYLRRQVFFTTPDNPKGYFEEYPQMPLIPWAAALLWHLVGERVWVVRLMIVLSSVCGIGALAVLSRRLTDDRSVASAAAFLAAILPLPVFFGRNIQPESPALLFLLLAFVWADRWRESRTWRHALLAGGSLCLSGLLKPTFLVPALAIGALLPARADWDRRAARQLAALVLCVVPVAAWYLASGLLNTRAPVLHETLARVSPFRAFTASYWRDSGGVVLSYLRLNFTDWGLVLSAAGIALAFSRPDGRLRRFLRLYALALVPYLMVVADWVAGHSYYQMPFVPLAALSAASAIAAAADLLRRWTRSRWAALAAWLALVPLLPSAARGIDAQFDTVHYGLDIAGEFLNAHVAEEDWFALAGQWQSHGIGFIAKRRYVMPRSADDLARIEREHNVRYVFVHGPVGIKALEESPDLWRVVKEEWSYRQVGLERRGGDLVPTYYILERGGPLDERVFGDEKPVKARTYDSRTRGAVEFFTLSAPRPSDGSDP
jgi:hypothetical protein